MDPIKEAKDILNYMRSSNVLSEEASQIITQIQLRKNNLTNVHPEAWHNLSKHRILSSNTLGRAQELKHWDTANGWVAGQIHSSQPLCFKALRQMNNLLLGGDMDLESPLRKIELYSGDCQYLPVEHLSEGQEILESQFVSEGQPLTKAFLVYMNITTLHPFINGNGRTARLAADWILLANGYLPLVFQSPIQSHIAVALNQPLRNLQRGYLKFLEAVMFSYKLLEPSDESQSAVTEVEKFFEAPDWKNKA